MHKSTNKAIAPLRDDLLRVAKLARIPVGEQEPFCDHVCDTVEVITKLDRRAASWKPGDALVKVAKAARALNEAVCGLTTADRNWVNMIADNHPWLAQETRLRGTTEDFQINELNQTVWLLATLFNFAVNQSSPPMSGIVGEPGRTSKKSGIGRDMMFELFLGRLLTAVAEAGGKLSFNKNNDSGTLAKALAILRPRLPPKVISLAPSLGHPGDKGRTR